MSFFVVSSCKASYFHMFLCMSVLLVCARLSLFFLCCSLFDTADLSRHTISHMCTMLNSRFHISLFKHVCILCFFVYCTCFFYVWGCYVVRSIVVFMFVCVVSMLCNQFACTVYGPRRARVYVCVFLFFVSLFVWNYLLQRVLLNTFFFLVFTSIYQCCFVIVVF